jgi:hypothetical protein
MDGGTVKLQKFNPAKIDSNRVVMCIGKRGTGKTTLTADILYHQRKRFDAGICFSSTEESNSFWGKHICDTLIHSDFNEKVFSNFITEQRRINKSSKTRINSFALLEDCMYNSKILKSNKDVRGTFFNGRHWNIFLIITMQYVLDLPPELRSNVDYVFILRNNMMGDREKIYKNFAGFIPSFTIFNKIMNKCTQGYEALVVDNTSRSNDISDCLFWYEAKIRDDFRVGKDSMWLYHYKMKKYNEDDNEADDDYYNSLLGVNDTVNRNTKVKKIN